MQTRSASEKKQTSPNDTFNSIDRQHKAEIL